MSHLILSLDGNIGAGKSTLLAEIRKALPDLHVVDEPVGQWTALHNAAGKNLLELFYEDKKRWSYTFQSSAYINRYTNMTEAIKKWDTSKIDIVSDIVNIPLESKSIDAILCSEVFEHLPNPVLAIQEFSRLIKKDGHLIITAPFCSVTHFSPYFYSTGFSKYYYEHHLEANGFEIKDIVYNGNYFESVASEIRSIDNIAQRFSKTGLSKFEKFCINILLKALQRFENSDGGSSELKCHGIFIHAIKK
jgi:SAM-dependent methyltransferase